MRSTPPRSARILYLALALLGVAGIFSALNSLVAGPVTGGASGPTTKITVYQGTMAITPGRGSSDTLEIGNPGISGIELASTGKIYFRPSGLAFDHAIWFDTSAGKTDVYVTGKLYVNGAAVPPWPSGGGVSYWQQISGSILPVPQGSTPRGVTLSQPIVNSSWYDKSAWQAVSSSASAAAQISNASGPALSLVGNGSIHGDVNITSGLTSPATYNGTKIWYAGNDGIGSGLDADMLDGKRLFLDFIGNNGTELGSTRTSSDGSLRCGNQLASWNSYCLCSADSAGCLILKP